MSAQDLFCVNRDADRNGVGNVGVPYLIRETLTATGEETKTFTTKVPHSGTVTGARMYSRGTDVADVTLKNDTTAFTRDTAKSATDNQVVEFGLLTTGRTLESATAALKAEFSAAGSVEIVVEIQPSLGI